MKFTTSASLSMLLAIVLAKTHCVEGWAYDPCRAADDMEDIIYRDYNMERIYQEHRRNCDEAGRRLAHDESFWSSHKIEACLDATYEANVVIKGAHLFFLVEPQDMDSKCPVVAVDNGAMYTDRDTLVPHVSILDKSPVEGLALDHSLTLGSLSEALSQMNPTDYSISANEYNLTRNNCATFLLHLCEKIGLDYHEPATNVNIVNYIGKSLAANEHFVDKVKKAYLEENTGTFQHMKFSVWNYYVGDEGMTRALVKNYMKVME